MTTHQVMVNNMAIGSGQPLVLIAGPCVIENETAAFEIARQMKQMTDDLNMPFIFKASFDKANRTSVTSFRGPGLMEGLAILKRIREQLSVSVLSDVHQVCDVAAAAEVLDVIQIPAFLCRQTDLLTAAAKTGKPVNVKKGQFLAPWDMAHAADKITSTGNHNILFTERGSMFGYNNLVVDFRSIKIMQDMGWPVIFDATHSVQIPGGAGQCSGGNREMAPLLAQAAAAALADGIFMEVHPDPDKALCDGPNSLRLDSVEKLLKRLIAVRTAANL